VVSDNAPDGSTWKPEDFRRRRPGKKQFRRFVSLGSALPRVIKRLKLQDTVAEQRLIAAWASVVGEKVAGHTKPLYVERKTLVVAVDNPSWMTQLVFLKPEIMRKLAARGGAGLVSDLRFVPERSRPSSP
jgi:predicted nucleic acid-binding Zn ribbon protein